jgi:DNA polymerase-3 subunit epsilon
MGEVLGFDFETTGVDRFNDVPVSYALVTLMAGERVATSAGLIDPGRAIPSGATEVHGISTERARAEGMPLNEAMEMIAAAVVSASVRGVPLVGMKLDYDLTILDTQSRTLCGRGLPERGWCGPVLDAVASVEVIFALAARFASLGEVEPIELHQAQIGWHREWAESYDEWRVGQGMNPMDRRDFVWPVASAAVPAQVMRLTA